VPLQVCAERAHGAAQKADRPVGVAASTPPVDLAGPSPEELESGPAGGASTDRSGSVGEIG